MTLVKICGLRDMEHMATAAEAGADLLGMNFLPTVRRYIPPETGAALASSTGAPVLVVAHDGGRYWPAHRFIKHAGTIQVRISPPMKFGGEKERKINELTEGWLREQMGELERLADG